MAAENFCDIEIKNLYKSYGTKNVLKGVSFQVEKGEVMGFLGSNGAGKSTTMNILTGYISSDSGTAKICGRDILTDPKGAKKNIGYLPEIPPVYPDMTVLEYLNFVCDLKCVKEDKQAHIDSILKRVKIDGVKNRLIKNLSKGYRQRVGLAQALAGNPKVLILDEPTVGLDPVQILEFRDIIKSLKGEHTVILSTHILQEVTAVCDRVTIINDGRVVISDKTENLSKPQGKMKYTAVFKSDPKEVLKELSGIEAVKAEGDINSYEITAERDIREELFNACAKAGVPLLELKRGNSSIEELFARATMSEKGENK